MASVGSDLADRLMETEARGASPGARLRRSHKGPHPGLPGSRTDMPARIKKAATDLLIMHGYRGASMAKIARRVGTTTTNIHYHFRTKARLVEEVIADYVENALDRQREIWITPGTALEDKILLVTEFNRSRHARFNRGKSGGKAWSLIGRMRLENDLLTESGRAALLRFSQELRTYIDVAVRQALERGEIVVETPLDDAALLLAKIVNSSSVLAQEAGSFEPLEEFYQVFSRFFFRSYGRP